MWVVLKIEEKKAPGRDRIKTETENYVLEKICPSVLQA